MLKIAGGIILAVIILALFPILLWIALYLIPPVLGVLIGGFIGAITEDTSGMLVGAVIGLGFEIWIDVAVSR